MSTIAGGLGHGRRVRAAAPDPDRRRGSSGRRVAGGRLMALPPPGPGTTCLITGASSGIGAELARGLAARGLGVTLVARREERLRGAGGRDRRRHGVRAEVDRRRRLQRARPRALFAEVEQRGLTVEVLVNNAGFGSGGRFTELDAAKEAGDGRARTARRSSRSPATTCPRWPSAAAARCSTSPR